MPHDLIESELQRSDTTDEIRRLRRIGELTANDSNGQLINEAHKTAPWRGPLLINLLSCLPGLICLALLAVLLVRRQSAKILKRTKTP